MTQDDPDYEDELTHAKSSLDQVREALPASLAAREDAFGRMLRAQNAGGLSKLRKLYALTDEVMAHVLPRTPCRGGCSSCCYGAVQLHDIEVAYIEQHTGRKRRSSPRPAANFHGQPCVFLRDGRCSIYEHRPFVCRTHVALTRSARWCHPSRSLERTFPLIRFTGLIDGLGHIVAQTGGGSPRDIRQVFDPDQ